MNRLALRKHVVWENSTQNQVPATRTPTHPPEREPRADNLGWQKPCKKHCSSGLCFLNTCHCRLSLLVKRGNSFVCRKFSRPKLLAHFLSWPKSTRVVRVSFSADLTPKEVARCFILTWNQFFLHNQRYVPVCMFDFLTALVSNGIPCAPAALCWPQRRQRPPPPSSPLVLPRPGARRRAPPVQRPGAAATRSRRLVADVGRRLPPLVGVVAALPRRHSRRLPAPFCRSNLQRPQSLPPRRRRRRRRCERGQRRRHFSAICEATTFEHSRGGRCRCVHVEVLFWLFTKMMTRL